MVYLVSYIAQIHNDGITISFRENPAVRSSPVNEDSLISSMNNRKKSKDNLSNDSLNNDVP